MKKIILLGTLMLLASCKKEGSITNKVTSTDSASLQQDSLNLQTPETLNTLTLDTFGFPAEVNGCSCYFSASKEDFDKEKYIYIDDYGNNAYVKTGGKLLKIEMKEGDFDPENFSKTIKNEEVTINITGKKVKELEEVMMFKGMMTVEMKNGDKTTTPIYGECGC